MEAGRSGGSLGNSEGVGFGFGVGVIIAVGGFFVGGGGNDLSTGGGDDFTGWVVSLGRGVLTTGAEINRTMN